MNALYVVASIVVVLTAMGVATRTMHTGRWPWQHDPQPMPRRHYCRTCLAKGQPAPAFDDWRELHHHDLAEHWGR